MNAKKALDFLICPVCKGDLCYEEHDNILVCVHDKLAFPIKDDICVLLPGSAQIINV